MIVHVNTTAIWEAEAGASLDPGTLRTAEATVRHCLKQTNKKN